MENNGIHIRVIFSYEEDKSNKIFYFQLLEIVHIKMIISLRLQ